MSTPDTNPLAQRLAEAAAIGMAGEAEAGEDLRGWTGRGLAGDASAAVVAVLRELAAKPDGYLRYQEDGGITYTRTLRALADSIEKGEG